MSDLICSGAAAGLAASFGVGKGFLSAGRFSLGMTPRTGGGDGLGGRDEGVEGPEPGPRAIPPRKAQQRMAHAAANLLIRFPGPASWPCHEPPFLHSPPASLSE